LISVEYLLVEPQSYFDNFLFEAQS
jgi:hypothetical protein